MGEESIGDLGENPKEEEISSPPVHSPLSATHLPDVPSSSGPPDFVPDLGLIDSRAEA